MSEDHAVPPGPAEHRRKLARLKKLAGIAFFGLIGVLWLLLEFGGESVHEALGIVGAIGVILWAITWPLRKWKEWQRRRARRRRGA